MPDALAAVLLLALRLAAWLLLLAAAGLSAAASTVQWAATTLAENAVSAMALGDPALRARFLRRPPPS